QRASGAATAADHPAEVVGVDLDLKQLTATQAAGLHLDVVRVVHDAADQVLERVGEHQAFSSLAGSSAAGASAAASSAAGASAAGSSAGAAAAASSAAFFSAALALTFSAASDAALTASAAAVDSPLTRSVPSAPGRPLNFCQSPVTLRSASTCSV